MVETTVKVGARGAAHREVPFEQVVLKRPRPVVVRGRLQFAGLAHNALDGCKMRADRSASILTSDGDYIFTWTFGIIFAVHDVAHSRRSAVQD